MHALLAADVASLRVSAPSSATSALPLDTCPCCLEALDAPLPPRAGGSAPEPVVTFTACPGSARHRAHAACASALASSCIAAGAAGEAPVPGTVPCPICVAACVPDPGCLIESQVAALVGADEMAVYRKARGAGRRASRRARHVLICDF